MPQATVANLSIIITQGRFKMLILTYVRMRKCDVTIIYVRTETLWETSFWVKRFQNGMAPSTSERKKHCWRTLFLENVSDYHTFRLCRTYTSKSVILDYDAITMIINAFLCGTSISVMCAHAYHVHRSVQ